MPLKKPRKRWRINARNGAQSEGRWTCKCCQRTVTNGRNWNEIRNCDDG
jgi:hypothetical protein